MFFFLWTVTRNICTRCIKVHESLVDKELQKEQRLNIVFSYQMTLNITGSNVGHICCTNTPEFRLSFCFALLWLVFEIIEVIGFAMRYNGNLEVKKSYLKSETQNLKNPQPTVIGTTTSSLEKIVYRSRQLTAEVNC